MGVSARRSRRPLSALLIGVAIVLLTGTLGLSLTMLSQARALDGKVKLTDGIVDANVRTLSQVQRELLRLELLLAQGSPTRSELALQGALVTQRVQEGTLSYQLQTLGSDALLERSRELAAQWRREGRPLLRTAAGTGADGRAARSRLARVTHQLELGYNQLVSDGENNRKLMAGQANSETKLLLSRARLLLLGLMATFVSIGVYFGLAGLVYRGFHRQRERDHADLVELNQELMKHAHVVRETDNMVVITDADGTIEWVNQAFERTTGFQHDEVLGRRPGELLQGPDSDPAVVRRMAEAVRAGRGFSEDVLNYTKTGQPYWNSVETTPIRTDDGRLTGFVSVQSDITERRRGEELLREAKEAAETTARAKTNFLASMSHEIRTPLNAVLGFTDLLLLTRLDAQQREYVRTAHSSGRLLLDLVNDILDFSALEDGRLEPERRVFHLADLVDQTVRMFEPQARRRGLEMSGSLDDCVPPYVWGDETRIRQVLVNLVGNAVKFTEQGSVRLLVSCDQETGQLRFAVSDTGIGIAADKLPRLFQPFTQGDASTTRRYGGTGLGLAISRLVTERMGGTITVTSVEGEGSTFVVSMPVEPASGDEAPPRPTALDGPDLSSLRVLLAEDDPVNQTVALHMLRRLGIVPDVVADGAAAVAAACSTAYDVVLMDVHMPQMDGVEATAAIRLELAEAAHQPRIVAVTANALEGDRERLLAAGMDDYLSKPIQLADLGAMLSRALTGGNRPAGPQEPAVDVELFAAQSGISDPSFLAELVDQLVPQGRDLLALAQTAIPDGPLAELGRQAHRVSGAAASCAARPLAAGAAAVEAACADNDATAAAGGIDVVRRTLSDVEAWRAGLASAASLA